MVSDIHFLLWYNKIPAMKETNYSYKFWFFNDFLSLKEKKKRIAEKYLFLKKETKKKSLNCIRERIHKKQWRRMITLETIILTLKKVTQRKKKKI